MAGAAHAAYVESVPGTFDPCGAVVRYVADPGEVNKVVTLHETLAPDEACINDSLTRGEVQFADANVTIRTGPNCASIVRTVAACSGVPRIAATEIFLGDMNDYFTAGLLTSLIDGGSGNDNIRSFNLSVDRVDCGPGIDTVFADKKDILVNCERVTRMAII